MGGTGGQDIRGQIAGRCLEMINSPAAFVSWQCHGWFLFVVEARLAAPDPENKKIGAITAWLSKLPTSLKMPGLIPSAGSGANGAKSAAFFPDVPVRRQILGRLSNPCPHSPVNAKSWNASSGKIAPTP